MKYIFLIISPLIFSINTLGYADTSPPSSDSTKTAVRYKEGGEINFEKLLVQGKLEKPALTVVTGSVEQGSDGLIRLRKNFIDYISNDFGEEIDSD